MYSNLQIHVVWRTLWHAQEPISSMKHCNAQDYVDLSIFVLWITNNSKDPIPSEVIVAQLYPLEPTVNISTACCNITKFCILPTQCICGFRMIFAINVCIINRIVLTVETACILCEVRAEFLCTV